MAGVEFVTTIHCHACGKKVSGLDEEMGLVVRALVTCPECLARQCINCMAVFEEHDIQAMFICRGFTVGPLCVRCADVVQEAKAAGVQTGPAHVQ